jgi:predicted GH43/DUF377 family glycosyl hydrolase
MNHATRPATDLADRFPANPLIGPADVRPSMPGMQVECLLNPGVFRLPDGRTGLLLRVAERPVRQEGRISLPICTAEGAVRILTFDRSDPLWWRMQFLDCSRGWPRAISSLRQPCW